MDAVIMPDERTELSWPRGTLGNRVFGLHDRRAQLITTATFNDNRPGAIKYRQGASVAGFAMEPFERLSPKTGVATQTAKVGEKML